MAYHTLPVALLLAVFITAPVLAHEGSTHVMGTVSTITTESLVVKGTDGKTVSIALSPNTRYSRAGASTTSAMPKVGDRVVVEVTPDFQGLTASEVRFSTVGPKKKP